MTQFDQWDEIIWSDEKERYMFKNSQTGEIKKMTLEEWTDWKESLETIEYSENTNVEKTEEEEEEEILSKIGDILTMAYEKTWENIQKEKGVE